MDAPFVPDRLPARAENGGTPAGDGEDESFETPFGTARVVRHAAQLDPEAWQATFGSTAKDFRYYELCEKTLQQPNFDYRYLLLTDRDGRVRALQPLFLTDQDLTAGLGAGPRRWVAAVRRRFPHFATMKMLMVGCTSGEGHLGVADPADAGAVVGLLEALEIYGRKHRTAIITFKDFPRQHRAALDGPARRRGFVRMPSFPATVIPLHEYKDFDDYLSRRLSHGMRKNLRRKFRSNADRPPVTMEVRTDVSDIVDEVHPLYLQVLARSDFRFEEMPSERRLAAETATFIRFSPKSSSPGADSGQDRAFRGDPMTLVRLARLVLTAIAALPLAAAAQLTVSTHALTFAPTPVGATSDVQAVILTNTGASAITFTGGPGSPAGSDFFVTGGCGNYLAAGQSCTGFVAFRPSVTGLRSTPFNIFVTNAPSPTTVTFSGTGTNGAPPQPLVFSSSAVTYHASVVGSVSAPQTVTVTNPNAFAVTDLGSGFAGANAAEFALTANSCGQTLPANASCSVSIVFTPAALGKRTASIMLNTSADAAIQTISLTGIVQPTTITVSALSPDNITAQAYGFFISVSGTGFTQGCTVSLGSTVLSTQYYDSTDLSGYVTADLVTAAKKTPITATCPTATTPVVSNAVDLTIAPLPAGDLIVNQVASDLVWDPQHKLLYASTPITAPTNPGSLVAINPTDGSIKQIVADSNQPGLLAISDDGQFLYAVVNGGVERYLLPSLTPDILVPVSGSAYFGPNSAYTLDVAPGAPHTWAVTVGEKTIFVYDDATRRPATALPSDYIVTTAVWGNDASVLYAGNTSQYSSLDFYKVPVGPYGVDQGSAKDYPGTLAETGSSIHFDRTTKNVYSDGGPVINPTTGAQVGLFNASGLMVPDGTLGKAFFVTQTGYYGPTTTLSSFDINTDQLISSFVFPNLIKAPTRLRRFGVNGLAFNEIDPYDIKTGRIYIYQGSFVE